MIILNVYIVCLVKKICISKYHFYIMRRVKFSNWLIIELYVLYKVLSKVSAVVSIPPFNLCILICVHLETAKLLCAYRVCFILSMKLKKHLIRLSFPNAKHNV